MAKNKDSKPVVPVPVDESTVTYWHKGKLGFVVYTTGKEPLTNKPIENTIKFQNHLYKTNVPEEIKILDECAARSPQTLKRFDEFSMLQAAEPEMIMMEIGGKKVKVPLSALKDSFKEEFQELSNLQEKSSIATVSNTKTT